MKFCPRRFDVGTWRQGGRVGREKEKKREGEWQKGQGRKDNNESEHPILGGKERKQGKARLKNTLGPFSGVTEWWG